MTGQRTPKRVFRLVASVALLALLVLPSVGPVPHVWAATWLRATAPAAAGISATAILSTAIPATPRGTTAINSTAIGAASTVADFAAVSLRRITPAIALPRVPITISGSVRNVGPVPIASPVVRAFIGAQPLISRDAVSQWADTNVDQQLVTEGVRKPLGPSLGPGRSASFILTVPASAIPQRESFAVLPLLVDVVGTVSTGSTSPGATSPGTTSAQTQNLGSLHTFLPALSSVKKYEPFDIAWLVPLTLDPDPALMGTDSAARTAAWTAAIGPGSRLDRLITGTDSSKVTWAIDPAVLGPPKATSSGNNTPAPTPTTSATAAPGQGGAASPDRVTQETTALADRLREAAPRHTLWSFPYADPDLTALLPLAPDVSTLGELITHSPTLASAVGSARTDIAWPVAGALTARREDQLRAAFSSGGLSAVVLSASNLANNSGHTQDASRRASDGLPLLAYDDALSRTFTQTSSAASGTITIQRFLADTMALLGERPGTPHRSVLVAAPRTFAGDPDVLRAFFDAIATAKWLVPATTDQLLAASQLAAPEAPGVVTTPKPLLPTGSPATPAPPAPADPLLPSASPLTAARLGTVSRMTSEIVGIASIRDDPDPFRTRWTDAQNQVVSARWRGHGRELDAIDTATQAAVSAVSRGVSVAPSSVNFFADKGVLQITVVNDLDVPVHGVRLTLTPGQPRLLIEQQPRSLRIGAKSRTNVQIRITAVAAGLVPIKAVLTTANGTPLGQNARVDVRVQPTSTWIYWVLGAVAGLILLLGTFRSLRRGSTRATRPAAREISLDV